MAQHTPDIPVDGNVDLTRPLPYAGGSFDVVILSEVVEHLPTYITVIHEAGRVLAQGGHLVLSTPNVQRLHSRWKFFWTGTHKLIRERPDAGVALHRAVRVPHQPARLPARAHAPAPGRTEDRAAPLQALQARARVAVPALPVHLAGGARGEVREKELARWMLHPAMLASEQLLLVAVKDKPSS